MAEQSMKPATAAKKLGIYLPATPESFRSGDVTRAQYQALVESPPEWLSTLRRDGPHPRAVVAQKLGVSASGLARSGVADVMTTAEIRALLEEMPDWLAHERGVQANVHRENARVKAERAARESRPRNSGV